jgi:hypothetical protein
MQRFLIITANCALLALLLIGLPAATHARFGNLQLSSASAGKTLTFWTLGLAAAANLLAARFLFKTRKQKMLCSEWAAIFGGLWLAYFGFVRGCFDFEWLKQMLLWLRKHF